MFRIFGIARARNQLFFWFLFLTARRTRYPSSSRAAPRKPCCLHSASVVGQHDDNLHRLPQGLHVPFPSFMPRDPCSLIRDLHPISSTTRY